MEWNLKIILLLFFCGCRNPNNPDFETEQILECVLSHLIDKSDSEKSMKVFVSDVKNWTDSTSYISVTVDTKNLRKLEGEFWVSKYNGYKIHQFLTSADTGLARDIDDLTQTTANKLTWKKQTAELFDSLDKEFPPPYDPPKIDFIYNPKRKCVEEYLVEGLFIEILNEQCKLCN